MTATRKNDDGTYNCQRCETAIRCTDCSALYTDNCGAGSVFVPAVE